jgi:nucleoside-diphosphate-sugar epimerase
MTSSTSPTVLVLGARGRFGSAAVQAFAAAGWQVLAHCRPDARPLPAAPANVRWVRADLRDSAGLLAQVQRADVVVHALNPIYTDAAWHREVPQLMEQAIAAARGLDALLMLPGNVYNFGAGMPPLLREDTAQRPTTLKGRLRVAAEQRLAQAATAGLKSVVLRAGDFFGPGRGTLLDMVLARSLRRGRITLPAGQDTPTAFAYLPDLARAFVAVAEQRAKLQGMTVLHFRGHVLRGRDWVDALADEARARGWLAGDAAPRVGGLPWGVLRAGAWLVPTWSSLVQTRYLWTTPHALDNTVLERLIGREPHTPLAEAVRQSLAADEAARAAGSGSAHATRTA